MTGPVSGNGSGPNNMVRPPIPTLDAEGNTVNVNSGASVTGIGVLGGYVYGGVAYTTGADTVTATGNSVNISNANVGSVSGGGAQSISGAATASGNRVNINNGATLSAQARGGDAESTSGAATANGNSVSISNGSTAYLVISGLAESTSGAATASGNSVNISNGATISYYVRGGNAESLSGTATASGNSVNISDATIADEVHGGYATSFSNTATASGNSVNINDATLATAVYGGYADSNGAGISGNAVNNRVVISNGEIGGDIFGGFSMVEGNPFVTHNDTGSATGNSVTLIGAPVLHGSLYGGFVGSFNPLTPAPGTDAFSGNTLHVAPNQVSGIRVGGSEGVQNFEFYNFTFQKDAPINAVGLDVPGAAVHLNDGASRASVIQSVNIQGGGSLLPIGHSFQLIAAGALDNANFNQTTTSGRQGVTLLYDYDLDIASDTLTATVIGIQAHPQAKALSEGFLSGTAFLNQAQDFAAAEGLTAALRAQNREEGTGARPQGFAAIGYSSLRHNTGSHIDVDGYTLLAGLAATTPTPTGDLTAAAFIEHGEGDYDSYNSFANAAKVHGKGDTKYTGAGILARFALNETPLYFDASIRSGKVKTDFSGNLFDTFGRAAAYDAKSTYVSAHVGLGYVITLTEQSKLDVYGQYLWSHQNGDTVKLTTGETVKFEDVDSQRTRLGAKWHHALNAKTTAYVGAAWEHEYDGKAKASTNGFAIDAPKLKGDTGLLEAGLTLTPTAANKQGWSLDLGVQGYAGKREGVTGSVRARYRF
ncbi:membrane protein [Betaproteobacteria bacterium]|nr:membrane protein [Betaproteobacteria bacterium]